MDVLTVLGIALALAMDAFAVSVALSLRPGGLSSRGALRLALHFGAFQLLMTVLGWLAGRHILTFISVFDHWVAFGLLLLVGGRMIVESQRKEKGTSRAKSDPTRGWSLVVLSVAVSIDALAVGLSLAALATGIWGSAAIIGLVAFGLSVLGARIGPAAGRILGRRAELAGGVVLILIGIRILVEHLTASGSGA